MLHQRTAELALVSFSMFEPRRKVVDYIRPVETSHYGFLIRDRPNQRGDNSVNWRAYTEPFAFDLWVTTAALLVCSAALWTVLESGSPSKSTEEGEHPPQPFWSVLGVLVQQGAFVLPETSSQRILFGSLWVFSVVLFASFTSNIVSLLASTRYVMPFETLEQLAALTDWKIIADPDSADLGLVTSLPEISGRHSIIKALLPHGLEILFTESDATLFTARINVDHVLRRNCSFVWSAIRATLEPGGAVIYEAWTFPGDPRPLTELRGYWTKAEGLWLEPRQYDGPKDFKGRTLRVAMLEDPPYVTLDNSSGKPVLGGYLPGVLDMLAAGLNFTPKIVCPKDGKFGYQLPNGTWNGIVGLLQHRRAELMLVSLVMLEQRRRVVDYLGPVEWTYYGFVIRDRTLRLGDSEVNWRAYTEPFSPALWTAAFALLLCAAGVWSAMAAAAPQAETNASEPGATATPAEPFWTVLGVLVQQGASVVPESSSQRILLGSLWVFSVVLFASFTSNIVSLLASTRYVMPFETLEQLAALTDWKIIANPESADLHQLFRIHELNRTGKLEPIKAFLPHALDILLTNDKTVLFTAFSNVDHVLRRNCSFVWSAIRVLPSAGYLTAQRDLPYRDAIATRLSHLSEAGLLKHLWEKTLLQPTAAGCRRLSQFSTMTLRQTAPALTLLAVGMLTAALQTR
ncbi:Glutamate receptor ionotropic, delta-1 [Amphibalanus amphitrite]|uniref:Glutamate receptor ionotropic, delta-1 n=1 Tax=Amphibalanus amphitrite TaxID=1232801 RepID=A0A6A4VWB4_AMPAM|nr:Glutamate receptor ionotropic, delta-1 [Amphibalanus amphitrite]